MNSLILQSLYVLVQISASNLFSFDSDLLYDCGRAGVF